MLPAVLDPWAGHALFEAARLAQSAPGSKVWLVSLGAKAKLQQVMMSGGAEGAAIELVALDGPASGFRRFVRDGGGTGGRYRRHRGDWIARGCCCSAAGNRYVARHAGSTLQMVGERLGIPEHFQGVDQSTVLADGGLEILERKGGGAASTRPASVCAALRRRCWAGRPWDSPGAEKQSAGGDGEHAHGECRRYSAPKRRRSRMPACASLSVTLPKQQRETRIVKNMPAEEIARELAAWMGEAITWKRFSYWRTTEDDGTLKASQRSKP